MSHDSTPSRIHFHYPFGGRVGVVYDPIEEAWTNGIWFLDWAKPQWPDSKDIEVPGRTITHRTPTKRADPSAVGADTL